ncbi:MAG: hypothetical protein J7507_11940 [Pseudoxanthomonas sp.]|nr:hypothetical protein [Pseudoxanthomonas sp.]
MSLHRARIALSCASWDEAGRQLSVTRERARQIAFEAIEKKAPHLLPPPKTKSGRCTWRKAALLALSDKTHNTLTRKILPIVSAESAARSLSALPPLERHYNTTDAAKIIGVTSASLRNMRVKDKGPRWTVTADGTIRYSESALRTYLGTRHD